MSRQELLRESFKKMKEQKTAKEREEDFRPGGKGAPVPKPKAGRPAGSTTAKQGGPKTNRTRHLALRVTEETGAAVDKAAYETHRTSSNWAETAILWALSEGAVKTRQLVPRPKGE
jgi:hypothetical protein